MFYRKSAAEQQKDLERMPSEFETQYSSEPSCFEVHEKWQVGCDQEQCRNWMNHEEDLNCAVVCARKNENGLPRISQIEHAAFKKLKDAGVFNQE